jgi:hypothetical protein
MLLAFTVDYLHKLCHFPAKLQTEAVIMTRNYIFLYKIWPSELESVLKLVEYDYVAVKLFHCHNP